MAYDIKVREKMKDLPSSWTILVLTGSLLQNDFNLALLRYLVNELNLQGVYVNVSRPYVYLLKELREEDVNLDSMLFIDAISKWLAEESEEMGNCIFLKKPSDLTSIAIATTEYMSRMKRMGVQSFVFIDSVSTLLIHNTEYLVGRFLHFVEARLKLWKIRGIFVLLKEDSDLIQEFAPFYDRVIDVSEDMRRFS